MKNKTNNNNKKVPNSLLWLFEANSLVKKQYLRDLDFIKKHTTVEYVVLSPRDGVHLQNLQQCHPVLAELTEYAHKIGLKVALHLVTHEGFYHAIFQTGNHPAIDQAQIFHISDPARAQAITRDIELVTDENGYAEYTHTAVWGRSKIAPIYGEILKAYTFDKIGEGFYKPGTLIDVTDKVNITDARTNQTRFEVDLGKEGAGKNIFVLLAQYYNHYAVSDEWVKFKELIDAYSDIPLDGIQLDEYGFMVLNTNDIMSGKEPPFRGRMYSKGMREYYAEKLDTDLDRLLFDMRYAPLGDEKIRIKAINTYFETLRAFPLDVEKKAYDYAKKIFGKDCYVSCHNTFHNFLDKDEIWRTACNWWDIPRDFGHTDENICFPVRWGIMLACNNPLMVDMYYHPDGRTHYDHIVNSAPYNCREFHHAYNDFYWGSSFTEPEFLKDIKTLDTHVFALNDFQTVYPKMDLLVIFGAAAQNNWYPDYEARNLWDIDGKLKILPKCKEMWEAGYRCALAPDYAIEDGRITLSGDKLSFGGQEFTHCLFLYPKYAKKETYDFLNKAHECGVKIAVVGKSGVDFEGNSVTLTAPYYESYDLNILSDMACEKSAIDGGCVYNDGSFALVSHGILDKSKTQFSFEINGAKHEGEHTGILAYRKGALAIATKGSELYVNGKQQEIDCNFFDK